MDEQLLAYFWGEDWKGEYPQWERYTDEQKADFTRLKALLATEYDRGYNAAPDVDGDYISLPEQDWKAALQAEYDRGLKDAAQPNEWRALQDAYDRGKVDELEAGLKLMQAIGDEQMAAYFESRLKTELKSKGEVKSE